MSEAARTLPAGTYEIKTTSNLVNPTYLNGSGDGVVSVNNENSKAKFVNTSSTYNERWDIQYNIAGYASYVTIRCLFTGFYLDGRAAMTDPPFALATSIYSGTDVPVRDPKTDSFFYWQIRLVPGTSDTYTFQSVSSEKFLDNIASDYAMVHPEGECCSSGQNHHYFNVRAC